MEVKQFQSVKNSSEILFKERNSKFYGFTFPIQNEEEFKAQLAILKERFPDSNHHCYAFRIGVEGEHYRYSDDGEPSNSAGKPIYGQLLSSEVTNIGAVVVRYFGGTKLGVGGLISAYREACRLSIEANEVIVTEIKNTYQISFGYEQTSLVDQLIHKYDLEEVSAEYGASCLKVVLCGLSQSLSFENEALEKQLSIKKAPSK